jgi:hypothetical protein
MESVLAQPFGSMIPDVMLARELLDLGHYKQLRRLVLDGQPGDRGHGSAVDEKGGRVVRLGKRQNTPRPRNESALTDRWQPAD